MNRFKEVLFENDSRGDEEKRKGFFGKEHTSLEKGESEKRKWKRSSRWGRVYLARSDQWIVDSGKDFIRLFALSDSIVIGVGVNTPLLQLLKPLLSLTKHQTPNIHATIVVWVRLICQVERLVMRMVTVAFVFADALLLLLLHLFKMVRKMEIGCSLLSYLSYSPVLLLTSQRLTNPLRVVCERVSSCSKIEFNSSASFEQNEE